MAESFGSRQQPAASVIRRRKEISDVFDIIDRLNGKRPQPLGAVEVKRIFYWNEQNRFDVTDPRFAKPPSKEELDAEVLMASAQAMPGEGGGAGGDGLPDFMQQRDSFGLKLPDFFGGGQIVFKKRSEFQMFEGRGWISENVYWRAPASREGAPRVRYMIHAILEWASQVPPRSDPNPHITLRNAETQALIDLDITSPLPADASKGARRGAKRPTRLDAKKAATTSSFSRGLGQARKPGAAMVQDDVTFDNLKSEAVKGWLKELAAAAQAALIAEPKGD